MSKCQAPSLGFSEFEAFIAHLLQKANIPFRTGEAVGGVQPDFVVEAPDGRLLIVEAKAWEKSPGFTVRAAQQAKLYKAKLGVDGAFLVIKNLERSRPSEGVVTSDELVNTLRKELQKSERPVKKRFPRRRRKRRKTIFAAMPFASKYDDTFLVAMAHAAKAVGAVCLRVDMEEFSGSIVDKIQDMIRNSAGVIVDLSESKPNVLYEAGYAHALLKPTVHICSTPVGKIPFDVSHWTVMKYHIGQTSRLGPKLASRLKSVLRT